MLICKAHNRNLRVNKELGEERKLKQCTLLTADLTEFFSFTAI